MLSTISVESAGEETPYLATKCRLHVLHIRRLLQPKPNHTDRWLVLIGTMKTACHVEGLPLRTQPDPTGLASTQRPPIPARFLLRLHQVFQPDARVSDNGILEEITVIDDLNRNDRRSTVGAEVFRGGFPNRLECVACNRRLVYVLIRGADVDFPEGVEIRSVHLARVEVLGLVQNEANNSDL